VSRPGPHRRLGSGAGLGWPVRWWDEVRPLDRVRSIKVKIAVLLAAGGAVTGLLQYYGVTVLHWRQRYSLAVAVVLSMAVSQVIAHGLTAPLRQMTAAARDLARGRRIGPVRATSRDEVGELARAFTAMAGELATADRQRRDLLANVGHELRTPVAALRATVENLADGVRPADPAALAEVLGQVERLGDLLVDFLDLAGADGGAVPLARRDVAVGDLVEAAVGPVRAARPGRSIQVVVEPPQLVADADPHRLAQVLTNLVDNAARHCGDDGRVEVRARSGTSGALVVEVQDDGPGIAPERWETVFGRFRGATGPAPGPDGLDGGTGLGLAIARWAVLLHSGTIAVVPSETGGCRIRVEIPRRH
jgi:signal transduction histidine kinase